MVEEDNVLMRRMGNGRVYVGSRCKECHEGSNTVITEFHEDNISLLVQWYMMFEGRQYEYKDRLTTYCVVSRGLAEGADKADKET